MLGGDVHRGAIGVSLSGRVGRGSLEGWTFEVDNEKLWKEEGLLRPAKERTPKRIRTRADVNVKIGGQAATVGRQW